MRHLIITIPLLISISSFSAEAKNDTNATAPKHSIAYPLKNPDTAVTIDSLKVGQKYLIKVESNGCFHHSDLFLTISKNKDRYFATFKIKGKIEGKKVNHNYKKVILTEAQVDSVRSFEKRLHQIAKQTYHCTTVDTYLLTLGAASSSFKVDNCDWQGIGKLVGHLFRKPEERPHNN
jgi:hypothetical protein